ncbi:MAG: D-alanine--D-alanine ligase [Thermodesulfovibrionales bacterium]
MQDKKGEPLLVTEKRIGVLMGGTSAEREVSLKSGMAVYRALEKKGYRVASLDVDQSVARLLEKEKIEVAFLVLHGGHGENGAIQGFLELMGIPYTGSGVLASALAMDKEASKRMFLGNGVPVPSFIEIRKSALKVPSLTSSSLGAGFALPWVVKPSTEGSSIGVSIVREEAKLSAALDQAFAFADRVMIEQYIEGKEVQVGILNDTALGSVEVRPKAEFYSYEAKYTPGMTEYILPPEIDPGLLSETERIALSAHRALGCKGATRVDLIIGKNSDPYVLEVNTIPGMTETSLLPKIAQLSGLDFTSLVEAILRDAITKP